MLTLKQTFSHVLIGQKGGPKRIQIIELIKERPYNINQLAEIMNLNYRTVKHHMDTLLRNGFVISSKSSGYGEVFFLSPLLEENFNLFEDLIKKTNITSSFTFFQNVIEQTKIAVILIDKDGETFFWNAAAEELFGYKVTEVMGKSIQIFLYSKSLEGIVKTAMRGKKSAAFDTVAKHKSGEIFDINARIDPIRDTEGSIIGFSILAQDITDQKKAERALRSSEERFKELFKNTLIGIYQTTPEGQILLANPALVRMLGFSSFIELSKRNLEKEGFAESVSRSDFKKRVERKGQVAGHETSWTKKDGSILHVRENATAVRDDKGNIVFYCGTVEDLSHQKKIHEDLHESKIMFDTLVSILPEAVIMADLEGKILYSSQRALEMYGYSNEKKILGKNIFDFVTPEDYRKATKFKNRILCEDTVIDAKYKSLRKDGSSFLTELSASVIRNSEGDPKAIIVTIKENSTR
ncbi:MAG: PAS domain S-box protein [Thermoplasmata archaeon]|nr:PAS domain S-box protein [Thermoplasmata archaeon]